MIPNQQYTLKILTLILIYKKKNTEKEKERLGT